MSGSSLNEVKNTLTGTQLRDICLETGRINQEIKRIACPCFGYPGQPEFQGDDWYSVFRKMIAAGTGDADRGNVGLKISESKLWVYLKRDKDFFEEVTEPRLVHWDCWDGNIFVADGKITGIFDWERSLWGDPLMEVGFRTYRDNTLFQRGYGIKKLTKAQEHRALWYDIYLLILVSLECEYRKYEQDTSPFKSPR